MNQFRNQKGKRPNNSNQPVPGTNRTIPGTSQTVPGIRQHVPGTSQPVPDTSQPVPGTSQPVPGTSQHFPGTSQPVSGTSQHFTGTSQHFIDAREQNVDYRVPMVIMDTTTTKGKSIAKRPRLNDNNPPSSDRTQRVEPIINVPNKDYEIALNENLVACVVTVDGSKMNRTQAKKVVRKLRDLLVNENREIKKMLEQNITVAEQPCFRGKPTYKDGALQLLCENQETLNWMNRMIPYIDTDHELKVVKPRDIIPRRRCSISVPGTVKDILTDLTVQNPWAQVGMWDVIATRKEKGGTILTVDIPEVVIRRLNDRDQRLCYLLESIRVNFQPGQTFPNAAPEPQPTVEENMHMLHELPTHGVFGDSIQEEVFNVESDDDYF